MYKLVTFSMIVIIQSGNAVADQVITVLLSTQMFVGGFVGFFLDNTIPGKTYIFQYCILFIIHLHREVANNYDVWRWDTLWHT